MPLIRVALHHIQVDKQLHRREHGHSRYAGQRCKLPVHNALIGLDAKEAHNGWQRYRGVAVTERLQEPVDLALQHITVREARRSHRRGGALGHIFFEVAG